MYNVNRLFFCFIEIPELVKETAQFLTEHIGGKILRKQFSMYQNNEFVNYLFGGKYNEKSFAKDLIARDSNVILLDEFDKAYFVFHSTFISYLMRKFMKIRIIGSM